MEKGKKINQSLPTEELLRQTTGTRPHKGKAKPEAKPEAGSKRNYKLIAEKAAETKRLNAEKRKQQEAEQSQKEIATLKGLLVDFVDVAQVLNEMLQEAEGNFGIVSRKTRKKAHAALNKVTPI